MEVSAGWCSRESQKGCKNDKICHEWKRRFEIIEMKGEGHRLVCSYI